MHTSFNTDDLLLIKKTLKHLKAQLRWKMVEKNNLEEVWKFVLIFLRLFLTVRRLADEGGGSFPLYPREQLRLYEKHTVV